MRRIAFIGLILFYSFELFAQIDFHSALNDCKVSGSITIYDLKNQKWLFSDSTDAKMETLPASTFKIINLLIALETGVIKNENEIIKWPGKIDTALYGYRPETYKDMTARQAFEVSAGWVFIELAKKVGREKYSKYLDSCKYGNDKLSEKGVDFWNFGAFAISPINQIQFLLKLYNKQLPFSARNLEVIRKVMIAERLKTGTISAKTGWTRVNGKDIGWWVGFLERQDNVYFFATKLVRDQTSTQTNFGKCRKEMTKNVFRQLSLID